MSWHLIPLLTQFNRKRYFKCRDIVMGEQYPMFLRKLCEIYVLRTNRRYGAGIYTSKAGGVQFDGMPILPHDLCGIFIASTAKIGKNCTILQQVTIGGNPSSYDGTAPVSQAATIGDDVIIAAGAKIIGNVKIGSHVRIGANAVVLQDIPDGCTAVGIPARIVEKKKSEEGTEHA